MDMTAQAVATGLATQLEEANHFRDEGDDWQTQGPRHEQHPGRFAFFTVTAPNGQTFKVTVEEVF